MNFKSLICKIKRKHDNNIVAIDRGVEWQFVDSDTVYTHVLHFNICSICGNRSLTVHDGNPASKKYAEEHNPKVTYMREKWVRHNIITPSNGDKNILYIDKEYAINSDILFYIKFMKKDPAVSKFIDENKSVKHAIDNLEITVKLNK